MLDMFNYYYIFECVFPIGIHKQFLYKSDLLYDEKISQFMINKVIFKIDCNNKQYYRLMKFITFHLNRKTGFKLLLLLNFVPFFSYFFTVDYKNNGFLCCTLISKLLSYVMGIKFNKKHCMIGTPDIFEALIGKYNIISTL